MIPKLQACLPRGLDVVPQAHIIDGPHARTRLLLELFTEAGIGTMVNA